ncbi:hypothetical protein KJ640_08280 [bacterium]|nr:hypothetical protein [bacterium]
MDKKESKKMEIETASYQPRVLNEGYRAKGEKIDPKDLKPPKGGTAASKPQASDSEKKDG